MNGLIQKVKELFTVKQSLVNEKMLSLAKFGTFSNNAFTYKLKQHYDVIIGH